MNAESLAHTKWECKYHVVFIPKCRKRVMFGQVKRHLGRVFHELAGHKECRIEEGHLMPDHVHMLISVPPKHSVAYVVGYIKGKSAIHIAREFGNVKSGFRGVTFWARGYYVSTVGADEHAVREYIRHQEDNDRRDDQQLLLGLKG
jgi:putative transposase